MKNNKSGIKKERSFGVIYSNIDKFIKIIGVLLLVVLNFIEKITFELYYGIPMEYAENNYYLNWKQFIIVLVILFLYFFMRYIKIKLNFESKIDTTIYIFLSILYGVVLGVYIFLVFTTILSFYISNHIQEILKKHSENFFWGILIMFMLICTAYFLLAISNNSKMQKISRIIINMIIIFLLVFIVKFSIGFSNKRNYEVINYENKLKVVLSKIDNNRKLIIADAIINEKEGSLIIDTKKYGNINNENLFFQYKTFRRVDVEK